MQGMFQKDITYVIPQWIIKEMYNDYDQFHFFPKNARFISVSKSSCDSEDSSLESRTQDTATIIFFDDSLSVLHSRKSPVDDYSIRRFLCYNGAIYLFDKENAK